MVEISPAHLGRVLAEAGLSFQRTRTWKASPDPDYEAKAARVLELKAAPPPDGGHVIAFDQMGPISLRPTAGAGWAERKRPERQRATYHQPHGTRYVFGAYDLHEDRLRVRLRPRRRGRDNLAFMPRSAPRSPPAGASTGSRTPLANWTPDIRAFAAANSIELVPTPTYASYLNPVECHFFPITSSWSTTPTTSTGTRSPGRWPATSTPQRSSPRPAHPAPRSPSPDRRLMGFPVKRSEKGH